MGVLPIGFFAPLPLAIMIPFMAAQSFAMGQAFGTSFQYGKRKISSMTNEQFNALSATDIHSDLQADVRAMIPSMNQSFERMQQFQIDIIKSMLDTFVLALKEFGQFLAGGISAGGQAVSDLNPLPDRLTVETRADIPSFIPQASADTQFDNIQIQTKFAIDFEREADRLPFKLLTSIVSKFGQTSSLKTYSPEMRSGYKTSFFRREKLQKKPDTPQEAIEKSATGIVKQIASMYAEAQRLISRYFNIKRINPKSPNVNGYKNTALTHMKKYNRFVTLNRKPGLQIDTAKSFASGYKIVVKTKRR